MKKLLSILGLVSLTVPNFSATMIVNPEVKMKALQLDYSTDSFRNIIKIVNTKYDNGKNMENKKIDTLLETIVPTYYSKYVNNKEGKVLKWSVEDRNDTKLVQPPYTNEYKNPSDLPQECLTQSRTETVEETYNVAMNLTEKVTTGVTEKLEGKISLPLGLGEVTESMSFQFGAEIGSEQSWSHSITKTVTETIPAQKIMQNPHTILHVKYSITQSTWDFNGIAQFKIDNLMEKGFNIPFFYFDEAGNFDYIVWNSYSVKDIVDILKEMGYEDLIDSNQTDKYSVLSVDNVNSPSNFFINLPITWNSPNTSGIILEHYEEPYYG